MLVYDEAIYLDVKLTVDDVMIYVIVNDNLYKLIKKLGPSEMFCKCINSCFDLLFA